MELSWTTFFLEIANFLILVWILKRFLYKPILDLLARRQERVQKMLADAEEKNAEVQRLDAQYRNRLEHWEEERAGARKQLAEEIHQERERQLEELRSTLDKEAERAHVLERRNLEDQTRQIETRAVQLGAEFVSKILTPVADAHLETKLIDVALGHLSRLSPEDQDAVRAAGANLKGPANVTTAFPLDDDRRVAVERALETILGKRIVCQFNQDSSLKAGIRIGLGPWTLSASLTDELKAFVESTHE